MEIVYHFRISVPDEIDDDTLAAIQAGGDPRDSDHAAIRRWLRPTIQNAEDSLGDGLPHEWGVEVEAVVP